MKKRILGVIAFAAVAIAAGWNYQQNKQDVELSDLAMVNVEALANDENIEVGVPCIIAPITCYVINDSFGHTIIPGYK